MVSGRMPAEYPGGRDLLPGGAGSPGVFDRLKDRDVRLWYMADDQVKLPWGAYPIYGGSTCLSRAPNLAWALGYREVHVFGGDSSFTHKTHVHGGELPANTMDAHVDGVATKRRAP
jgi:hypothetical protein